MNTSKAEVKQSLLERIIEDYDLEGITDLDLIRALVDAGVPTEEAEAIAQEAEQLTTLNEINLKNLTMAALIGVMTSAGLSTATQAQTVKNLFSMNNTDRVEQTVDSLKFTSYDDFSNYIKSNQDDLFELERSSTFQVTIDGSRFMVGIGVSSSMQSAARSGATKALGAIARLDGVQIKRPAGTSNRIVLRNGSKFLVVSLLPLDTDTMKEQRKMIRPIRVEFYKRYHSPDSHKEITMEALPGITLDQIVDNVGKVMDRDYYELAQIYFMDKLWGHVYYKRGKPTFKKGRIKLPKDIREEEKTESRITVSREDKGLRVTLQPDIKRPKYTTLAFISNSGLISYYQPKSTIEPRFLRKIKEIQTLIDAGQIDSLYPREKVKPQVKLGDREREVY